MWHQKWTIGLMGLLCVFALIQPCVEAQPVAANDVERSLAKLGSGKFGLVDVNRIAEARVLDAIPLLQEQFAEKKDDRTRKALASALVRLGVKDSIYWDLLADGAKQAVETDVPFPSRFDWDGKLVRGQYSPDFLQWVKSHKVAPDQAAYEQVYQFPGDLLFLVMTGDERGLTLLRKGMLSRNYLVQGIAAKGLAKLRDNESIPLIIHACERAPADAASAIAIPLLFFNDPGAQLAGERFIGDKRLVDEYHKKFKEKGPDGVF